MPTALGFASFGLGLAAEQLRQCPGHLTHADMRPDALPARAEELVKQFVGSTERLLFYLAAVDGSEASSWLTVLCSPTPEDVEQTLLQAVRTRHFRVLHPILTSQKLQLQWPALAQALEVSCSSDAVDVTALLLPPYKALRASTSTWSSHHRRLLCSALGTRHLPTLQLLLECEPRGKVRHLPELVAALEAEEAPNSSLVAILAILAGQEADEVNNPVLWDPETLLRAIGHGDLEFVQFLMAYVQLHQDALTAALEAAKATENLEVVRAIATRLQTAKDLEVPVSASQASTVSGSSETLHFVASNAVDGFVSAATKRLVACIEVKTAPHDLETVVDPPEAEKEESTDLERLENASLTEPAEESQPPALKPAEPVVVPVEPLVLTALLPQEVSKSEAKVRELPLQPAKTSATRPTHAIIPCQVNWTLSTANASALAVTSAPPLHEGDRVEARYKGRAAFFPGVVAVCHADGASYDVVYDDGEEEKGVEREYLRLLPGQDVDTLALKHEEEDAATAIPTENHSPTASVRSLSSCEAYSQEEEDRGESLEPLEAENELQTARKDSLEAPIQPFDATVTLPDPCQLRDLKFTSVSALEPQIPRVKSAPLARSKSLELTTASPMPQLPQLPSIGLDVADLPEIPTILVSSPASVKSEKEPLGDTRPPSHTKPSQTRGVSPANSLISPLELAEWRNVDLLLNRKRRLLQAQTGSVESTRVPWGEQFATIQSLKRFAVQHPLVLREYIETQLQDLDGPLASPSSPGKPQSPRPTRSSVHSGAAQARDSLLLVKDLAFLLRHRLAPFFDLILPVVLPTVFHAEKRFLCETATEVLEAIVLHCSGRKLALLLLQLGEGYSKHEDFRLVNLTSIYVDKCVGNWSKAEMAGLRTSRSTPELMTLLAALLGSKSAPARISAQKSVARLREELGPHGLELVLRDHVPQDVQDQVLQLGGVTRGLHIPRSPARGTSRGSQQRSATSIGETKGPTIVRSSPGILQRMLLQRQNRVLPSEP